MEKHSNKFVVALSTLGGMALLLGAFMLVWLASRGPETGVAQTTSTPGGLQQGNQTLKNAALAQADGTAAGQTRRFAYGSPNLVGATDPEFAEFVRDWASNRLKPKGIPEVLFARQVSYDEIPALGLGCPPNVPTVEQPPLMLAILRGDFDLRGAGPGFGRGNPHAAGAKNYVVYIFDVWAARPMVTITSETGDIVKKALKDPSLPDLDQPLPAVCATSMPLSQRTRHYGEVAPGLPVPTHSVLPKESASETLATPVPASTALPRDNNSIPVYETPDVPAPVPTTGQLSNTATNP